MIYIIQRLQSGDSDEPVSQTRGQASEARLSPVCAPPVSLFPHVPLHWRSLGWRSPPPRVPEDEGANDTGSDAHAAEDGHAHEALFGDLVVDELAQVRGLQVGGLLVDEEVVVPAGLAVVAELVVAEGEVVEALAAALGREAEDVGEEADAELLVAALVGFDEALGGSGVSGVYGGQITRAVPRRS